MSDYFGKDTFKLGFGLMRLPRNADNTIDIAQTAEMTDRFLEAGGTYFDTAYVYEGSEEAIREALVKRHPRESYTLATKLNGWMGCKNEAEAKQQIYTSLERTQAGYFDYYLLHAIQEANYKKYDEYHLWDYVRELKEKGLIRHYGFSFHATPELLDKLLTEHPDVEFVQLQLNYADWENPSVQSRANYEVARKHGKSVVVMEPLKGGRLANPPESVQQVFREENPALPMASWGIRYIASLDGILTVLSGMSSLGQMEENLSYMKNFQPMTAAEKAAVVRAQEALARVDQVPCTACHYCTPGCPQEIPIPDIFRALNEILIYNNRRDAQMQYDRVTQGRNGAAACIQCGQCESACPQQIPVITRLKEAAAALESA